MNVEVEGTQLWFDGDGLGLVPDGPVLQARPTILLVHGGPGIYDHSCRKPAFDRSHELAGLLLARVLRDVR